MAFDFSNFDKLSAAANTTVRKIWAYTNLSDTLATISAANYFLDVYYNLDVGDEIFVYGSNGYSTVVVTAVSSTSVTVAALAEVPADSITNNEINSAAAIAFSKLATLPSGQILVGSAGGVPTAVAMTGIVSISNTGVTSITDLSIVNADISASAAIDFNKLAPLSSARLLVGSAGNAATAVDVTGDVTISNTGVTAIAADTIINADVKSDAAIAFSKLATLASARLIVGSAGGVPTAVDVTGDVTISNAGVTAIAADTIINADVKTDAAIAFSKLASLTSAQILVGSAGNVPTAVAMSGDITIGNTGVTAIGANKVLSSMMSPLLLKYAAVTMSAAQFNGAYAAPHLLVAAGGANTLLVLEGAYALMTYGTTQFANGGVAHIQYDSTANGAGILASTTQAAANFFDAASTALYFNPGVVKNPFTTCVNKGLYFSNVTGAFDTGDSNFVVHVWYRQIPTV